MRGALSGIMKSRTKAGVQDARWILFIIIGPPLGAAHLLLCDSIGLSLLAFFVWLVLCFPLMQWLSRKGWARKGYVLSMVVIMSCFYGALFYAGATA